MVIKNSTLQYGKMILLICTVKILFVYNGYALCFKEARLSTTIGSDIEHNKFFGQVPTIMKVISNKFDVFVSQFGNISENDIPLLERLADLPPQFRSTPH